MFPHNNRRTTAAVRAALAARGVRAIVVFAVLALSGCGGRDASVTQAPAESLGAPASLPQNDAGTASTNRRAELGGLRSEAPAGAASAERQPSARLAAESARPGNPDPSDDTVAAPSANSSPESSTASRNEGEQSPRQPKLDAGLALGLSPLDSSSATLRGTGAAPPPKRPEGGLPDPTSGTGTDQRGEGSNYKEYTYYDGNVERTVQLLPQQQSEKRDGDGARAVAGQSSPEGVPTFLSESGSEMTLPGGVILVLDPDWSTDEVDEFFASNDIKRSRASELGWIGNGFLVETEPGLESLLLANSLATQHGVVISSPNWARESTAR